MGTRRPRDTGAAAARASGAESTCAKCYKNTMQKVLEQSVTKIRCGKGKDVSRAECDKNTVGEYAHIVTKIH